MSKDESHTALYDKKCEGTQVLWHQDAGYTEHLVQKVDSGTSVNAFRMINVWTPLVPARPENGCMQFIPGTHKLGVVPHESKKHYLEIAGDILEPLLQNAVDVILDPGDIVLFNNLLFHQGQPNLSATIRWSIDWRYQDLTQPTNRKEEGHVARSRENPASAVQSAEEWANLSWR
jgi:phytanoyl-CoA hydroxylase